MDLSDPTVVQGLASKRLWGRRTPKLGSSRDWYAGDGWSCTVPLHTGGAARVLAHTLRWYLWEPSLRQRREGWRQAAGCLRVGLKRRAAPAVCLPVRGCGFGEAGQVKREPLPRKFARAVRLCTQKRSNTNKHINNAAAHTGLTCRSYTPGSGPMWTGPTVDVLAVGECTTMTSSFSPWTTLKGPAAAKKNASLESSCMGQRPMK